MAEDRRFSKYREVSDVLTALQFLVRRHELWEDIAGAVSDSTVSSLQSGVSGLVDVLQSIPGAEPIAKQMNEFIRARPHMGLPAVTPNGAAHSDASREDALMARAKKAEWTTHKNTAGKKTHWTARWSGMKLRIDRKKAPLAPGKKPEVIFLGCIDDLETPVTRGKVLSRVQAEVEAEALRRLTTKTPG